jgi:plasmid rolling circle replication initiator protein Rep
MEFYNSDERILSASNRKTQSEFLTDLSPKDKPWDKNKAFSGDMVSMLSQSENKAHRKHGVRIDECAQNLEFGYVLVSTETGETKLRLKLARFCRVRYCPVCQWRRALMWVSRFFDAFPRIYAAYPDMRYIMLTLTVRNCSITDLRATVNQMSKAWERLTKRKDYPALGFVRSLEVTPEKDLYKNSKGEKSDTPKKGYSLVRKARPDYCHPHYHILLAVPPSYFGKNYLSKDDWAALWQDAMRLDYKPVCDVRIVKPRKNKETVLVEGMTVPESIPDPMKVLMSAVTETIKYTTKPADMVKEKSWLFEMVDQMRNVRAVALGGIFKQFLKETETEQDLITAAETEADKVIKNEGGVHFNFIGKIKRYKRFYPLAISPAKENPEIVEARRADLSRLAQQAVARLNEFESNISPEENAEMVEAKRIELKNEAVKALERVNQFG